MFHKFRDTILCNRGGVGVYPSSWEFYLEKKEERGKEGEKGEGEGEREGDWGIPNSPSLFVSAVMMRDNCENIDMR